MNGGEEVYVTFDGQSGHPLQTDDVIEITRRNRPLGCVKASKRDVLRRAASEVEIGRALRKRQPW